MARNRKQKLLPPARRRASTGYSGPHSWALAKWDVQAPDVFPGSYLKARYLVRIYKEPLFLAGALTRIGKDLVMLGEPYDRWLKAQRSEVVNYNANFAGLERYREEARANGVYRAVTA